jgi:ATP-binding cassette subfamily B protein
VAAAFQRARQYLKYHRAASLGAIGASISLGVLGIALLAIAGLVVDLLAERGEIRFRPGEAQAFPIWLTETLGDADAANALIAKQAHDNAFGLISLAWRTRHDWYCDVFAVPAGHLAWTQNNQSYLIGLLVIGFVVGLSYCGMVVVMHLLATSASLEALTRLRRSVYHQAYRLGTLTLQTLQTTEALGLFTRSLEAVRDGLHSWLTAYFREPARFIAFLLFAVLVESASTGGMPWLTLAFLMTAGLAAVIGTWLSARAQQREHVYAFRAADQLAFLQESLQLMRLVKCYLMEVFNQARVERQLARHASLVSDRYRSRALYSQGLRVLGILALVVLLSLVGWSVLAGQRSLGSAVVLSASLGALYRPLWTWLEHGRTLRRAQRASRAVFAFLDRQGAVGQFVGAKFLAPISQTLEVQDVSIREPGTDQLLLDRVSATIHAGQRVGIVGQEELAKHALVYMVPRFLDPAAGQLRIDGEDLRGVTLDGLRAQVALVMQHDLVFNDTVANNIGCGDAAFTLPQIMEAAKVAHCHQFIMQLPDGYETRIGDLGQKLDLGQQFRIALARAVLRDPAIVIIEETYGPLSEETKALIDDTYDRFLPGRTVLFLPHRLSTIKSCDQIFLLHEGQLAAQGPHRELIQSSELYRQFEFLEFSVLAE